LETLGWLIVAAGLAAFMLAAVTVIVLAVRAVQRRRSIRAIRHISHAADEGLIRPDELKRYGDILRARVEYPDDGNGHEDKGAA
jgi:exosome complex RNA-binding protein Csl4